MPIGFRQSLAFRLAVLYSVVFALGAAALIAAFVWTAARALEAPAKADVETRAADLVRAFEHGGRPALIQRISEHSTGGNPLFARIVSPKNEVEYMIAPSDWVETEIERIQLPGAFLTREIPTVRVPKNAERDFTIATRRLNDDSTLQVGRSTESRAVLLAPLWFTFAGLGIGAMVLSIGAGTLLAWRSTQPLRAVSDTAHKILVTGDSKARVPAPAGSGELADLVRQLNTLLDRNAAHVSTLRETLDNIAHDMRTPLTRLRGTAELALHKNDNPNEAREALGDCVEQSDRLLHLLNTLLDVSAAEAGALKLNRERIDLRTLVERGVDLYKEVAEVKGIRFFVQLTPVEASVDAIRFGQAINNLIDNALKYTPNGGQVTVATEKENDWAIVSVTDNGPGVPVSEHDKIWRRLYRSDSSRSQRGLGLGLSLVRAIVEAHGGTASVTHAPVAGARFEIRIPKL